MKIVHGVPVDIKNIALHARVHILTLRQLKRHNASVSYHKSLSLTYWIHTDWMNAQHINCHSMRITVTVDQLECIHYDLLHEWHITSAIIDCANNYAHVCLFINTLFCNTWHASITGVFPLLVTTSRSVPCLASNFMSEAFPLLAAICIGSNPFWLVNPRTDESINKEGVAHYRGVTNYTS